MDVASGRLDIPAPCRLDIRLSSLARSLLRLASMPSRTAPRYTVHLNLLVIGTALVVLGGCTAIRGYPNETNPDTPLERENKRLSQECSGKPTAAERKGCRDALVYQRLRVVDRDFFEFANAVRGEGTKLNLATDLAVLALSGAGATAPAAAPVLAAISGGLTGGRAAVDKDTFYDKTMPALLAAMEAQRHEVLVKIEAGLILPADGYSVDAALTDVEAYRRAGSIDGAITQITQESGESVAKSDRDIERIRKGSFLRDQAGDALRTFWKPDGRTIDRNNEAALREWMKKNDVEGASITFFLRTEAFKDARLKAARDLELPGLGG